MEVKEFERFVKNCRTIFRAELDGNGDFIGTIYENFKIMFKFMLERCCSAFEEEILKEHLQEEFLEYMDSLQKTEGA